MGILLLHTNFEEPLNKTEQTHITVMNMETIIVKTKQYTF